MHEYPLRIPIPLWNRVVIEAETRGLTKNKMLQEIIEKGLLKIFEEEAKYVEIKYKQIDSELHS